MEYKFNLPMEIVNKILIMRGTHPNAELIKPKFKEYNVFIKNFPMYLGFIDFADYIFKMEHHRKHYNTHSDSDSDLDESDSDTDSDTD